MLPHNPSQDVSAKAGISLLPLQKAALECKGEAAHPWAGNSLCDLFCVGCSTLKTWLELSLESSFNNRLRGSMSMERNWLGE